jgi:hypothetical protein
MSKVYEWIRKKNVMVIDFFSNTHENLDKLLIRSLHSKDDSSIFAFNSIAHKSSVKIMKLLLLLLVMSCIYFSCLGSGLFFEYIGLEKLFIGNKTRVMCINDVHSTDMWFGCPAFGVIMIMCCVLIILAIIICVAYVRNECSNTVENDFSIEYKKTYGTFNGGDNDHIVYDGL